MSYILDALKKSDRSRQLNTTTSLSLTPVQSQEYFPWKTRLLIGVLSVIIIFFIARWVTEQSVEMHQTSVSEQSAGALVKLDNKSHTGTENENVQESERESKLRNEDKFTAVALPTEQQSIQKREKSNHQVQGKDSQDNEEALFSATLSDTQLKTRNLQSLLNSPTEKEKITVQQLQTGKTDNTSSVGQLEAQQDDVEIDQYPNYRNVRSQLSGLDALHLDILAHHAEAKKSAAYINMQKYFVGDETPQGATIDAIKSSGVVMSYQGTRFILTPK